MEWIIGFILAFIIGILGGAMVLFISDYEGAGFTGGVIIFAALFVLFGLIYEIPYGSYMQVRDGQVIKSKIGSVVAWSAEPEYVEYSDLVYKKTFVYYDDSNAPAVKSLKYSISYRVQDEDLSKAQLYYDKLIKNKRNHGDVAARAAGIVQKNLIPGADAHRQIREIFKNQLEKHGLKLVSISIDEE